MTQRRLTRAIGDYTRSFATEGGENYRVEHQELGPAMARTQLIMEAQQRFGTGQYDRRYVGSVPMTLIADWCRKNHFTIDQWARNDGGIPGMMYPESKSGVKDKFMRYFLSREFSKLHTQHVTTRSESGVFVVPDRGVNNAKSGRPKDNDS